MVKFNKEFFVGLTAGFGAGVVVGAFVDKDKRSVKGMSKELMRVSLLSFEKMKEGAVRAKENFEDLTAEVRSEMRNRAGADNTSYDNKEAESNVFSSRS